MTTLHSADSRCRVAQLFPEKLASWANPDTSLLRSGMARTPSFPGKLLGSFWAEWCEDVSASANAPFDYAGASLLTLAGALIGNKRTVTAGSWSEPPILWSVLIGNPSSGKSPAMDPFMDLITGFEAELNAETATKIYIDDASAQATAEVAAANPNGLLLFRDELSGWWSSFGQLGGEQFWLKAFGARSHTVIRKEKAPIHVPRLAVSVLGGSQPDTIRAFVEAKNNRGFASRWLYVFPNAVAGFRLAEAPNHALAQDALWRLLLLPHDGKPLACPISPNALRKLESWVGAKRDAAAADGSIWGEWLGKQGGVALRVALILEHLWWAAESPLDQSPPLIVSEAAFDAATSFIDIYSAPMAALTFDVAARPMEDRAAIKLAGLLRKSGHQTFNARSVRRGSLGPAGELSKAPLMAGACEVLEAAHLIRHVGLRASESAGRRPADYEVNPSLLAMQAEGMR